MNKKLLYFFLILTILSYKVSIYGYTNPDLIKAINYYKILKSKKVKDKENFSSVVIQKLYKSYIHSKKTHEKALSLFLIGKTYLYLTEQKDIGNEIFVDLTISSFYRLIKEFPDSTLCDDAKYFIAYVRYYYKNVPSMALQDINQLLKKYPHGDYVKKAKKLRNEILKKFPHLKKRKSVKYRYKNSLIRIRDFVGINYFRIVFDLKKIPEYEVINEEFSVTVVLKSTYLDKKFKIINLNNKSFDKRIDIQKEKNNLILSINTDKISELKYFILTNPNRLVIDVETQKEFIKKPHERIQTIVIDPGHGGKDPGAHYYGLKEKDVTLKIAKMLRKQLKKILPKKNRYKIYLTRQTDRFIELEDRVKFANKLNADLFISIHNNAARDKNIKGFQTFYLNPSKDRIKICTTSEIQAIIDDLMRVARISESEKFANIVHQSLLKHLRKIYTQIEDHGVKKAPFYVLVSTKMPAILVEVSFISNPLENRRLRNYYYLKNVSYGIAKGIVSYIKNTEFIKK